MNRRSFLSALLASPVLIRAAFKNLPKVGDPIQIPLIGIDPASPKDHARWWLVSTPGSNDRMFREYMREVADQPDLDEIFERLYRVKRARNSDARPTIYITAQTEVEMGEWIPRIAESFTVKRI